MIAEAFLCLALNVYHEARHLGRAEQLAVAHVVLNRVADGAFPDTVCGVVAEGGEFGGCQFSWFCDGTDVSPRNTRAWAVAEDVAGSVESVEDPTGGALYYHANWLSVDGWWWTLNVVYKDRGHTFYVN